MDLNVTGGVHMDNKNLAGKEIYKNRTQSMPINRSASLFDTKVSIHMNQEEQRELVFEPIEIKRMTTLHSNEMHFFETLKNNVQEEQVENQELEVLENEQELQKTEQIRGVQTQLPINLEEKEENIEKKELLETNKPGERLERYIVEVETKKTVEKNKSASLESALAFAKECKNALEDKELALRDKVKLMNLALKDIDKYIKETKGFGRKNSNLEQDNEQRDLREAAKMLRVQLFLEKMELVEAESKTEEKGEQKAEEKEVIDEVELYRQQLEADARIKLYSEYQNKNQEEQKEVEQQEQPKVDIQQRKQQQLLAENNRQIQTYAAKIEESEQKAKELQKKMGANGYEIRHKQFLRSPLYQQKIEKEIARIRPLVIKEWLEDNIQRIMQNATKLLEIVSQEKIKNIAVKKDKKILFRMSDLASLFKTDISDDEKLAIAAVQYSYFFDTIATLKKATSLFIDSELKDLLAAQIVLFEKRELLKKEWNEAEGIEKKEETKQKETNIVEQHTKTEEEQANQELTLAGQPKEVQAVAIWGQLVNGKKVRFSEARKMAFIFSQMNNEELNNYGINHNIAEVLKRFLQASFNAKNRKDRNYAAITDGTENEQLVTTSDTQEMSLERITAVESNMPKKVYALDDGSETAYAERFLKKLDPNYNGPIVEEYSDEEGRAEYERQQGTLVKYKKIYDYMATQKEVMSKPASSQFETMMSCFDQYAKASVYGPIKEQVYEEFKEALENFISAVTVRSPKLKQDMRLTVALSNTDMEKVMESVNNHWKAIGPAKATYTLLLADEKKVQQERLERERREQAEQTQREEEIQAQQKKQEDLEFQRINNEYALQGMASEEKEKGKATNKDLFREGSGIMISGFESKYQEIHGMMLQLDGTKADTSYIDQVREEFLKQFNDYDSEYYSKENASSEEEVGVLLSKMSEFYSQKILELQPVYDWLYERKK